MNINSNLRSAPVSAPRGAPRGRANVWSAENPAIYVQRVYPVDGDYSADGTYWGMGPGTLPLWSGFNGTHCLVFYRAQARDGAIDAILIDYPDAEILDDVAGGIEPVDFAEAYVTAALWSSTGDDGEPLEDTRGPNDMSSECLQAMQETCTDFIAGNAADLSEYADRMKGAEWSPSARAGHDFWLTRNGHGCGFWDRGLGALGDRLTSAARVYSGVDLYIGDDGLVYGG